MAEQYLLLPVILIVSYLGWKTANLSGSGAVAAVFVGVSIVFAMGWQGLVVLGSFFATSSFWSKFKRKDKSSIEEMLAKTSRRDWQQVLANGGSAMIFSLLFFWLGDPVFILGFSIALAAANADTWASEIGPLSMQKPVSVKTFRRVEKGTSGAVSLSGSAASLAGALVIALVSSLLFNEITSDLILLIAIGGFLGSFLDTLLGAFLQEEYECRRCGRITEAEIHCGNSAKRIKGMRMVNNEVVNFSSPLLAACIIVILLKAL